MTTAIIIEPTTPHPVHRNVLMLDTPIVRTILARVVLPGDGEWLNAIHHVTHDGEFYLIEAYNEYGDCMYSNRRDTLEEVLALAQNIHDQYAESA